MGKIISNGIDYTGGGRMILNENGTALADEPKLQFKDGLTASDDSVNTKTVVGVDTTFTEAVTRTNIASGDSFSTILGKIKKWFTDIPNTFVKKSGDSMSGRLAMVGSEPCIDIGELSHQGKLYITGHDPDYETTIINDSANELTADRKLYLPNKSGTIVVDSDLSNYVPKGVPHLTAVETVTGGTRMTNAMASGEICIAKIMVDSNDYYPIWIAFSGRGSTYVSGYGKSSSHEWFSRLSHSSGKYKMENAVADGNDVLANSKLTMYRLSL